MTLHTPPSFGHWLKQRRRALKMTQIDLARQAGCAEVTLRKIEAGDAIPSAALAACLSRAVGASDDDLPEIVAFARGVGIRHALASNWGKARYPHNLPKQLTPLFGRSHDIAAVRRRLVAEGARLITLVGPPGVGKTRLSLAVAEAVLEQFIDGVFFVRLGPVDDPALVASTISRALGLQLGGPNPPAQQLCAYLEEKHLLLVLDNFEQILPAASLVDDLLRRCPWLHILVTSRQPLRVRAERQIIVQPLALPAALTGANPVAAKDVLQYSAVALFAERAQAVLCDFVVDDANAAAVAELCRRLDGLPLAIELVAARVKLLPPAGLLPRLQGPWLLSVDGLRDVSMRQRSLRGAIGWSYDLLTPLEQILFRNLAVFVGGFTLEAAELLCGDTLSPSLPFALSPCQVLDGVASLLEKSLLVREVGPSERVRYPFVKMTHGYGADSESRYTMLETVREYGLERLDANGETELLRARHAACFVRLVDQAERSDPHPTLVLMLCLIDRELHNIHAARAWAVEHDTQTALLLTAAFLRWSQSQGTYAEGARALAEILALPGAADHTVARAKTLLWGSYRLMRDEQNVSTSQALVAESLALSRELGYPKGEAQALTVQGRMAQERFGDTETALRCYTQALALYQAMDNAGGMAYVLTYLGDAALDQGDYRQARVLAESALAAAQRAGMSSYPLPLATLANAALAEGDLDRARALFEQRLAVLQFGRFHSDLAIVLMELSAVTLLQGDLAAAQVYVDEARIHLKKVGSESLLSASTMFIAVLTQAQGNYADALRWYRASLADLSHLLKRYWSFCLLNLASLTMMLGQHELTARLLGAIKSADETVTRLNASQRRECDRLAEAARSRLDAACFDAALAEGRKSSFLQAAEEAVAILEEVLHIS